MERDRGGHQDARRGRFQEDDAREKVWKDRGMEDERERRRRREREEESGTLAVENDVKKVERTIKADSQDGDDGEKLIINCTKCKRVYVTEDDLK